MRPKAYESAKIVYTVLKFEIKFQIQIDIGVIDSMHYLLETDNFTVQNP